MHAPRLTPKGQATRARIVEAAAELVAERGAHGTSNEQLRARAGVSGSQLTHYFPDKAGWVRAALAWRAGPALAAHRRAQPGQPRPAAELGRARPARRVRRARGELAKSELDGHDEGRAGFDRWTELFRGGFQAMRDRGELAPGADPGHLARVLLAADQSASLLARATGDATLHGALTQLTTFAEPREEPRGEGEA
ncbi:TetR/AcrR family transcriptional regulator [Amycolatopsis sp. NPDC051903]|uniref:TetR/AcrR family transcriptional regulator n=1 Tax=Amycolatopsis sp. NPDC051903 TaxID=3363936 RepID=UPI0037B0EE01